MNHWALATFRDIYCTHFDSVLVDIDFIFIDHLAVKSKIIQTYNELSIMYFTQRPQHVRGNVTKYCSCTINFLQHPFAAS